MRSDTNAVDMQYLIVGAFMGIRYFYNSEYTKHAAYEPRYLNTVSIPQIETGAFWYCSHCRYSHHIALVTLCQICQVLAVMLSNAVPQFDTSRVFFMT
jgi:hypothetical protein